MLTRNVPCVALLAMATGLCGAAPSMPVAMPFGGAALNAPASAYTINAAFTPDGKTIYMSKSLAGWANESIVVSRMVNGVWQRPRLASFSGQYADADPFVTRDGKRIFFASLRPVAGDVATHYRIWYVERTKTGWGAPVPLGPNVNGGSATLSPSVASDGTLYFTRVVGTQAHIYRSALRAGAYAPATKLVFSGTTFELDATISSDQRFIVLAARASDSLGQTDLYISFRQPGGWSAPRNLGPGVNSVASELATGLSPDDRTLYFASNRATVRDPSAGRIDDEEFERDLAAPENGLFHEYAANISMLVR